MAKQAVKRITKRVEVSLGEVIDRDFEDFLDLIAERAGDPLMGDIRYIVVGANPDAVGTASGSGASIVIEVSGEPSDEYEGD